RVGGIVGDYNGGTVVNCFTTYTSIGSTAEGFVENAEKDIQDMTDKFCKELDAISAAKEKEILTV
ncbi:MAG: hypothetical protein IJC19_04170, partial [Clostridia bacterium]|nr:hypothetical protein [Clostridia bacterium]